MAVFRLALILLIIGGAAAQVQPEPQNVAVLLGSKARFNCSTTNAKGIAWSLNGVMVVSIQTEFWTSDSNRFNAVNYTTPGSVKWEFIISNVEKSDAGEVSCQFLGEKARVAGLSVQERGSVEIIGGNRTVTQGAQTKFQCQAIGWSPEPNMVWSVNGVVVKNCTNSSVSQGNMFNTSCTLTVTAATNSSVQCLAKVPAMSSPDSSTVFLTVVYLRGSVEIIGGNRTVTQGAQTKFQCQAIGWSPEPNMVWSVNGVVVKNCTNSSVSQGNMFNTSCTLTVTAATNSSVQCLAKVPAMSSPDSSTVFLTVVYLRGSVEIIGGNRTVTQGAQTKFQCQAIGWSPEPNMVWSVNGVVVKNCTNSSVSQGNMFNTSCTLTVTAATNSSVQCLAKVPAMSSPDSSTVFLTVGPKPRDQTILIAVTVAFSAAALLFLIIFGIIFFCKRRKKEKSGYQEEVRRARLQSQRMTPVTSNARGRDNRGYFTDGRYEDYNGGVWHTDSFPKPQRSYPKERDFLDDGYRNQRHMTMV